MTEEASADDSRCAADAIGARRCGNMADRSTEARDDAIISLSNVIAYDARAQRVTDEAKTELIMPQKIFIAMSRAVSTGDTEMLFYDDVYGHEIARRAVLRSLGLDAKSPLHVSFIRVCETCRARRLSGAKIAPNRRRRGVAARAVA